MSSKSRVRFFRASWNQLGFASVLLGAGCIPAVADIIVGTLSAATPNNYPVGVYNASIPAHDVSTWMQANVPNAAQSLVTLTECYGGNAASDFTGLNTAVLSATSPYQLAIYGGFDSGAFAKLAPGAANNGMTVFQGGVATKAASESPITGGTLNPAAFSLKPAGAAAAVQGRQILVYAGQPGGPANNDVNQLTTIQTNFAAETGANPPLTKISSIGDGGNAPWQNPGDAYNLQNQIQLAGTRISGAANPAKQQFMLYVTDHGGLRNVATNLNRTSSQSTPNTVVPVKNDATPAPPAFPDPYPPVAGSGIGTPVPLVQNFQTFVPGVGGFDPTQLNPNGAGSQQPGSPVFSILLPFSDPTDLKNLTPGGILNPGVAAPSSWTLYLQNTVAGMPNAVLTGSFEDLYTPDSTIAANGAYNYNAANDANKDAGVQVNFQIKVAGNYPQPNAPDGTFNGIFLNQSYDVYLVNNTGLDWNVGEFGQDLSLVAPGVPEPGCLSLLAISAMGLMSRRSRRA